MDATDLLRTLLPQTSWELLSRGVTDFLDTAKLNRIPMLCNRTDAFLRIAVFGGTTKDFKTVLLAAIIYDDS